MGEQVGGCTEVVMCVWGVCMEHLCVFGGEGG